MRDTGPLLAAVLLLAAATAATARPLLARSRNATDYIRWYVAELPAEYRMEQNRLWGYDFLHGPLLPSKNEATTTWRTYWEHVGCRVRQAAGTGAPQPNRRPHTPPPRRRLAPTPLLAPTRRR
jgi:hypothetical protein